MLKVLKMSLTELEDQIQCPECGTGLKQSMALWAIRKVGLWKDHYYTFEDYAAKTWNIDLKTALSIIGVVDDSVGQYGTASEIKMMPLTNNRNGRVRKRTLEEIEVIHGRS